MRVRVVHLRYPSPAARLQLISSSLGRLAPARWLFVDIPDVLEVVLLQPRGGVEVTDWLAACLADGLAREAREVPAAAALDARLFFGEPAPAFYVQALAIGSARAARLLEAGFVPD